MLTRLRYWLRGVDADLNDLADRFGAPRKYVICPHCGAHQWRLPPHPISSPCPLVERMAESFGLKFDAERMMSIRAGHQMEQVSRFFEEHFREEDAE